MSKAEEYAALRREVARLCERMDESQHQHLLYRDATDNLCRWEYRNGDLIERALRVLNIIENPSCALLDDLRKALQCETHAEPRAALAVLAALYESTR